jgi:ABC-type oligopeptide transport system substrate-binding subunit
MADKKAPEAEVVTKAPAAKAAKPAAPAKAAKPAAPAKAAKPVAAAKAAAPVAAANTAKKTIVVQQYASAARRPAVQTATLKGLGLNKIRLFADASVPDWGIAINTMLTAAGFEVDLQSKPISEIVTAVLTNKDYDLTTWAYGMSDELPTNYVQLAGTFAAPAGRYGYSSPEMVAAIDLMRTASTDAQRTAAYAAVTKIWTRDVPAVVTTSAPTALIFSAKLHGAVRTAGANILFDKAYLDK